MEGARVPLRSEGNPGPSRALLTQNYWFWFSPR